MNRNLFINLHQRAFWGALVTAIVCLVATDYAWRSNLIGKLPLGLLSRDSRDDFVFNYHQIANIPADTIPVVIFGGSGMREAVPIPDDLTAVLQERNPSYHGVIATSRSRTLADDLALMQSLPEGPGILIYGSNFSRFGWDNDAFSRFVSGSGVIAPAAILYEQQFDIALPEPDGLIALIRRWIRDNTYLNNGIRYYADRIRALVRGSSGVYIQHRPFAMVTAEIRERQLQGWINNRTDGNAPARLTQFTQWFENLVHMARAKHYEVLIIDQPLDLDSIDGRLDAVLANYREAIWHFAVQHDLTYLDVLSLPSFDPVHFRDLAHFNGDVPRAEYTRFLMHHIPSEPVTRQ